MGQRRTPMNRDVIEKGGKSPGTAPPTPPVAQDYIPDAPMGGVVDVTPADQSPEYLAPAKNIIAHRLFGQTGLMMGQAQLAAAGVLSSLAAAGWHLLNAEDAEKMLGAYVLHQIRGGRYTVPLPGPGLTSDELAACDYCGRAMVLIPERGHFDGCIYGQGQAEVRSDDDG